MHNERNRCWPGRTTYTTTPGQHSTNWTNMYILYLHAFGWPYQFKMICFAQAKRLHVAGQMGHTLWSFSPMKKHEIHRNGALYDKREKKICEKRIDATHTKTTSFNFEKKKKKQIVVNPVHFKLHRVFFLINSSFDNIGLYDIRVFFCIFLRNGWF